MNLEFELRLLSKNDGRVVYEISRKGLEVGIMTLKEPYNRKEALSQIMRME